MVDSVLKPHVRTPSKRAGSNVSSSRADKRVSHDRMARRLRSSAGTNRHIKSRLVAGRCDEAALPDCGIDRVHVTLDPVLLHSYLTVRNIKVYSRCGDTRIAFDCPNQIGPNSSVTPRRVTAALKTICDQQFDIGDQVRAFGIHTPVVIGNKLLKTHIWLVEMPVRTTDLVLGSDTLNDMFQVGSAVAFCLGQPRHSFMDLPLSMLSSGHLAFG